MNPLKWKVKVVLTFFLYLWSRFDSFVCMFFFVEFRLRLLGSFYILLQLVFLWIAWLQLLRLAQSE